MSAIEARAVEARQFRMLYLPVAPFPAVLHDEAKAFQDLRNFRAAQTVDFLFEPRDGVVNYAHDGVTPRVVSPQITISAIGRGCCALPHRAACADGLWQLGGNILNLHQFRA